MHKHATHSRLHRLAATAAASLGLLTLAPLETAQAALLARDLNNDNIADAYYDTLLDISWYAVAGNFFANQNDARAWAQGLSVGAAGDWRLPDVLPVNGQNYEMLVTNNGSSDRGTAATGIGWGTASEMGHLFYVTLQNIGYWIVDPLNPTSMVLNPLWDPQAHDNGPMDWVAGDAPYLAEQTVGPLQMPWAISFRTGLQYLINDGPLAGYAMAVHDGDVGNLGGGGNEVPVPGTLLLAGGALCTIAGRAGIRRRQRSGGWTASG